MWSWIWVDPKCNGKVLRNDIKGRNEREESYIKMRQRLQWRSQKPSTAKGCAQAPGAGERQEGFSSPALGGNRAPPTLWLQTSPSRTLSEYIFIVLSHQICGNLLPWEMNTTNLTVKHTEIPTLTIVFFFSNSKSSISRGIENRKSLFQSGFVGAKPCDLPHFTLQHIDHRRK